MGAATAGAPLSPRARERTYFNASDADVAFGGVPLRAGRSITAAQARGALTVGWDPDNQLRTLVLVQEEAPNFSAYSIRYLTVDIPGSNLKAAVNLVRYMRPEAGRKYMLYVFVQKRALSPLLANQEMEPQEIVNTIQENSREYSEKSFHVEAARQDWDL